MMECGLTDPNTTELAAATVAAGLVTFASREELAALIPPVADDILARRRALLDEPASNLPGRDARAALRLVRDAVAASSGRRDPLGDTEVVQLARALTHNWVRDACLRFAVGDLAEAAEQLWLELARGCPIPERANPASLFAFSAYIRGEGPLASIALDQASSAQPGHTLSDLLRTALEAGIPPAETIEIVYGATAEADFLLEDDDRSTTT